MRIFGFVVKISRRKQTDHNIIESQCKLHSASWEPTHRHINGGLYRYLYEGIGEAYHSTIVVYDDREGQVWVRSCKEFYDGRFSSIENE